jgi:hypothetical protein
MAVMRVARPGVPIGRHHRSVAFDPPGLDDQPVGERAAQRFMKSGVMDFLANKPRIGESFGVPGSNILHVQVPVFIGEARQHRSATERATMRPSME